MKGGKKSDLLVNVATFPVAVLLNGMLLWQFVPPELLDGSRAAFVAALALIAQLVLALYLRSKPNRPARLLISLMILQSLVFLFSLAIGDFNSYGVWKLQGFVIFALVPSVFILWNYASRPFALRTLFTQLFLLACVPLILVVVNPEMLAPGFLRYLLNQMGIDVIGIERCLGVGALLGFIALSQKELGMLRKITCSVIVLGLCSLMVMIGERGPILGTLAALSYFFVVSRPSGTSFTTRWRILTLSLLVLSTVVLLPMLLPRFSVDSLASDGRWTYYSTAFNLLADNLVFGSGLGGFALDPTSGNDRSYFHNVFGEILTETGFVGLICSVALFLLPLAILPLHVSKMPDELRLIFRTAMSLFVFAFINANVSGDLTTNYLLWVSFALLYCTRNKVRSSCSPLSGRA